MIQNLTSTKISLYYDRTESQNDPIAFQLDLKQLTNADGDDIYVTEPFSPPRQPFKIDVSDILIF